MTNLENNKFLQAVVLDMVAAGVTEPTADKIAEFMQKRILRDYELGSWMLGNSEAARETRTTLGEVTFVAIHQQAVRARGVAC